MHYCFLPAIIGEDAELPEIDHDPARHPLDDRGRPRAFTMIRHEKAKSLTQIMLIYGCAP
jgi:hypothetical protein